MSARGRVILLGQRPANTLGPVARNADNQIVARFQYSRHFAYGCLVIFNVFQNFRANDQIEPIIFKGQSGDIGSGEVDRTDFVNGVGWFPAVPGAVQMRTQTLQP